MKFRFEGSSKTFDAVGFGPTWNGWVQPIVTENTLREVIVHWDVLDDEMFHTILVTPDGTATIAERYRDPDAEYDPGANYDITVKPDDSGHYTLTLGLTLVEVS